MGSTVSRYLAGNGEVGSNKNTGDAIAKATSTLAQKPHSLASQLPKEVIKHIASFAQGDYQTAKNLRLVCAFLRGQVVKSDLVRAYALSLGLPIDNTGDVKDLYLALVKHDGSKLKLVPPPHNDDLSITSAAVAEDPDSFAHAGPLSRARVDLARTTLEYNGDNLQFVAPSINSSPELIHIVLNGREPWGFEYAGDEAKDDYDLGLLAVKKWGDNFKHLSARQRSNPNIIMEALKKNPNNWAHVPVEARENPVLSCAAVRASVKNIRLVDEPLKNDPTLARLVIDRDPSLFKECGSAAKSSYPLALEAVIALPSNYYELSPELQADPDIQRAAGLKVRLLSNFYKS